MFKSFYVIKPRITMPDIYYKVYVTDISFYFIKIGGQFHNRDAYEYQLPLIFQVIFWPLFKKMQRKQAELEAEYDKQMDKNQASELLQKKHNFSIAGTEIKQIVIDETGTFHTGFCDNGTISFVLTNGKKYKFIIPMATSRSSMKESIKEFHPALTIEEKGGYSFFLKER